MIFIADSVLVDLGSFQVFGLATDVQQSEFGNESRPVLAKPTLATLASEEKLLKVEFETNPIDKKADYRVKIQTQSLEIKYNAVRFLLIGNILTKLRSISANYQQISRMFRTRYSSKFTRVNLSIILEDHSFIYFSSELNKLLIRLIPT